MFRQVSSLSMGPLVAAMVAVLLFGIIHTDAQVTFSRDWNAGKRSIEECAASWKSASGVCRTLMNELRAIASCEVRALAQRIPEEDNLPEVFVPSHAGRR